MSSPESIAQAFARGLMEGLVGQQKTEKQPRPKVVKTDEVRQAVGEYLGQLLGEEQPQPGTQTDLFDLPPQHDYAEPIIRRVDQDRIDAAAARAERNENREPPDTYNPDLPGEGRPWTAPAVE